MQDDKRRPIDMTRVTLIALAVFALVIGLATLVSPKAKADTIKGKGSSIATSEAAPADHSWTGCYASINLGYASQSTELAGLVSFDAKDVTYGVGAGCDYALKGMNLVIGVMGDIDWTKADSIVAKYNHSWFVGGRVGILVSPNTLFYGLAGSALMALPFSVDHKGLTLGLGLETMLAKSWSLRAEYRHVDLGSDLGGVVDQSQQAFRLGLVYRF